jgi:macrolide-specific efflux system membrane fusion protein
MQVTAEFPETEATKIRAGQAAAVTVNALAGQRLQATVVSVAITPTVVSNVVDFPVTLQLTNPASSLRPGETANISVIADQADNVLFVPASSVTTRGGASTVTVVQGSTQRTQTVVLGLQGDSTDQIMSGLTPGQRVLLTTGTTGFPAGGFPAGGGGLGGARLGGGGLGGLGGGRG